MLGETAQAHLVKLHQTDLCLLDSVSVKDNYNWLVAKKYQFPERVVKYWTLDLNKNDMQENWERLCKKLSVIQQPNFQDFQRSFLLRAYYTNIQLSLFTQKSSNCSFCNCEKETWCHLFWSCPKVARLWDRIKDLAQQYIDPDTVLDMSGCLLSDFPIDVLILITAVTKHYIFLARLNSWPLSYVKVLSAIKRQWDMHLERTPSQFMEKYYSFWGQLIGDSVFDSESNIWADF